MASKRTGKQSNRRGTKGGRLLARKLLEGGVGSHHRNGLKPPRGTAAHRLEGLVLQNLPMASLAEAPSSRGFRSLLEGTQGGAARLQDSLPAACQVQPAFGVSLLGIRGKGEEGLCSH